MKKRISILLLYLLLTPAHRIQGQDNSLRELDWILGTWIRQNSKPGETHYEKWWKLSDVHYQGLGVVTSGSDTLFTEKLAIIIEENHVYYVADVQENPEPVYFRFSSMEKNSFVSENPEHDAPRKIAYTLKGNVMTAHVSWEGGGFEAVFRRME